MAESMKFEPQGIKALAFDVGGTVFNWHQTVCDAVDALAGERGADVDAGTFANAWRLGMFAVLSEVRFGARGAMSTDAMQRASLRKLAADYPALALSAADIDGLAGVWHRLTPWPDVPDAVNRLRDDYTTVVLTVMGWGAMMASSKAAGIAWDSILSCEFLGVWKPDAEAYLTVPRLLALRPDEVMMVAAHPDDLSAAAAAGLRTAYVIRPATCEPGYDPTDFPRADFDLNARDFPDLVRQLCPGA